MVAIFARLDVLGFQRLEYELTPEALDLGLDAALPPILELRSQIGEFGRGERSQNDDFDDPRLISSQSCPGGSRVAAATAGNADFPTVKVAGRHGAAGINS